MLEQIRNATKSWLALIVVGLLVVSFALWGVQDIFTQDLNDPVAEVGNTNISVQEFAIAYDQQYRNVYQQFGGQLTSAQAIEMGLPLDVIDNLVRRALMNQAAAAFDLSVSNARLSREIVSTPAFFGPSGSFDQFTYAEQLRSAGFTQDTFADAIRNDLTRNQLLSTLTSGVFMPEPMTRALYSYAFEERVMEYFLLPAEAAGEIVDPDDEALEAFYLDNLSDYRAAEYRGLTVLRISAESLMDGIEITEEDIQTIYDIRAQIYQIPERRTMQQLAFSTLADANIALAALEAGTAFEDIDAVYIDLGSLRLVEMSDPTVGAAAFALEDVGRTDIVEGALSYSIIQVSEISPAITTPLSEVRDEIRDTLALQLASEEIYEIYEQAADMRAGGEDIAVIGERLRQQVITVDAVDAAGLNREGEIQDDLVSIEGMLRQAFQTPEGEDTNFHDTQDGEFYVARVDSIIPASVYPLADIRQRVLTDWRVAELDGILGTMAAQTATRINLGEDFTDVAAELGRVVRLSPTPLRRSDPTEVFTVDVLTQLFTTRGGNVVAGPVQLGSSHVVARVTAVHHADMDGATAQIATLQQQMSRLMTNEIGNQFIDQAEQRANVRINEVVLNQALNSSQAQQ